MSRRRWLPPLLWAGVILSGTSLPQGAVPIQTSGVDKYLHFSIYTVLGFLLTWQLLEKNKAWVAVLVAVVVSIAFGAADEWHQQFIPGRYPELADWQADSLGALTGAVAAALTLGRKRQTSDLAQ